MPVLLMKVQWYSGMYSILTLELLTAGNMYEVWKLGGKVYFSSALQWMRRP